MFTCRINAVWILTLLLQLALGVAQTTDPLTDLGRSFIIFHLYFSWRHHNYSLSVFLKQRILLGSWFSIRRREMPPMWGTEENWLQMFPLRPCLNSLIPRGISARQSSPTHGTWGMGMRTFPYLKYKWRFGFSLSFIHLLIANAERWSKGLSRLFAIITQNQGTTHCGSK